MQTRSVSIHAPVWVRLFNVQPEFPIAMFQSTHPCGCDGGREYALKVNGANSFCANLLPNGNPSCLKVYYKKCQSTDFNDLQQSPISREISVSLGLAQTDCRLCHPSRNYRFLLVSSTCFYARRSAALRPATFSFTVIPKIKGRSVSNGAALKCSPVSNTAKETVNAHGQ